MGLSSILAPGSIAKPGVCTSSTRPASPYNGQLIYETDTRKVYIHNGTSWVEQPTAGMVDAKGDLLVGTAADTAARLAVGTNDKILIAASGETTGLKWAAINEFGAAGTDWTPQLWQGANVTSTPTYAKYIRINKMVFISIDLTATAAGTAGNAIEIRNLPVTAAAANAIRGEFVYLDAGVQFYAGTIYGASTTSIRMLWQGAGNFLGAGVTLANTDYFLCGIYYEAA